jgi:hypothetical protein
VSGRYGTGMVWRVSSLHRPGARFASRAFSANLARFAGVRHQDAGCLTPTIGSILLLQ